jgi:hypothetical protein
MTDASAAAMAFFGLVAVLFVLIPGTEYYARMIGTGKEKLPNWWGRLWFLGFAAIAFYLSLRHFLMHK